MTIEASDEINGNVYRKEEDARRKTYYAGLTRKFVWITLICSLLPLLLVGWGINMHYTRFSKSRMIDTFQTQVEYHRKMIELFLRERSSKLQLIALTHSKDYLRRPSNLAHIFDIMNRENRSITDLGVIDEQGRHLAYIGPYDLMEKNYSQAFWFKKVMKKGLFISDMFKGFRKVPHFIIAVRREEKGEKWILRATVDTEYFRSLVENVRIGKTGEVYLLNQEGIFQTSPRFSGRIMEKAPFAMESIHEGIKIREIEADGKDEEHRFPPQIVAQAWLKEPRWLLVVSQNHSESFSEVNHANVAVLIFLHLSAFTILIVSMLTTRHLIKVIKSRDLEADALNKQLLQAGKLASIGELSAGVAHEINNPLAIILTERQILLDAMEHSPGLNGEFMERLKKSLLQIDVQVHRCKRITQNLLRFARRTRSVIETLDLNAFITEVIELMEREARASGIKFFAQLDETIPYILSDPSQLQQVFLNLITNAIDAHDGKPYGSIHIYTQVDKKKEGVIIQITDTGAGIAQDIVDKIFDPFFTTKPVGKGNGLGLTICYSIIKNLGGDILVDSEIGKGTTFSLFLPNKPPPHLESSIEGDSDKAQASIY